MSIKGFPNQKKLTGALAPFTEAQCNNTSEFVTIQPTYSDKNGLDSVQLGLFRTHASPKTATPDANYPNRIFTSTAHGASVGDVIRFEIGSTNPGFESGVGAVPDANTIILNGETPLPIIGTDTFYVLRYITPRYGEDGATVTSIDPSGLATAANQVTMITSLQLLDDAVGTDGAAAPTKGYAVGGTDGTNYQIMKVDTSGRPDVTVNSSALPTGAATEAKQDDIITDLGTIDNSLQIIDASVNTLLKPGDTLAKVGEVTSILNPLPAGTNVIGHVIVDSSDLPTGAATSANQTNGSQKSQLVDAAGDVTDVVPLGTQIVSGDKGLVANAVIHGLNSSGGGSYVDVKVTPSGALVAEVTGTVTANAGTNLNTSALNLEATQAAMSAKLPATLGQKTMANSMAVVFASDQSAISLAANQSVNLSQVAGTTTSVNTGAVDAGTQRVVESNVSSATVASVNSSNSNVTLLASSSTRRGAAFHNNSVENCYLKFGATASATSYTVKMGPNAYYELPQPVYSGIIDGIWDNTAGSMKVTSW